VALLLVINPVIQFFCYEFLKKKLKSIENDCVRFFVAGAVSKFIATIGTYPFLTIKTCLQAKRKDIDFLESIKKVFV